MQLAHIAHRERIGFRHPHQHTDLPHSFGLLGARRKRPHDRRAAEKANELTSPHIRTQAQATALYRHKGTLIGGEIDIKTIAACTANVTDGSFASKAAEAVLPCTSAALPKADVNSPPWLPPLCANKRHMQRSKITLLDHLVGEREQPRRNCETERFGDLEIDHELELGRLLDWHVGRLGAAQNLVAKFCGATEKTKEVRPVRTLDLPPQRTRGWNTSREVVARVPS